MCPAMTDALAIARETTQKEIRPAETLRDAVRALPSETTEDFAVLGEVLTHTKGQAKRLDELRTNITKPINQALRATNDLFRPALKAYEEAEKIVKEKIADYVARSRAAQEAALLEGRPSEAPASAAGVSTRIRKGFRIADEVAVPREFCTADPEKIRAHLDAGGECPAGVVIVDEIQVIGRSK